MKRLDATAVIRTIEVSSPRLAGQIPASRTVGVIAARLRPSDASHRLSATYHTVKLRPTYQIVAHKAVDRPAISGTARDGGSRSTSLYSI